MRSLLLGVLCLTSSCVFIFDGDDEGDKACPEYDTPAIAPAPLRDPGDLTCDAFYGGTCNPECGPCPAATSGVAPIPPIPSWPICGHVCESKGYAECEADPQCRVVLDADCSFGNSACLTDYLGCFPIDTQPDASIACFTADAWDCSRSAGCTAYHSLGACTPDGECERPFELCAPEGQSPGQCYEQVTCRALPPPCPAGTTPGILSGCYTGACIPQHLCGPQI